MLKTTLPEVYKYEKRYWYPHMMPADVAIWERFINKYPDAYDTCQYDVPCGSGASFDTVVSPDTGGDVNKLYQKKIDVVASKAGGLQIIELKPRAGAGAVGQIKNYRRLYIKDYNPPEAVTTRIITDAASAELIEFAKDEGVEIIVV